MDKPDRPVACGQRQAQSRVLLIAIILFLSATALRTAVCQSSSPSTSAVSSLPSDTPEKLRPVTDSFDYVKRDVMIPMRDGVKLHTIIMVPRGAKSAPILLTRTPYSATGQVTHNYSSHLGPALSGYDNAVEVIVDGGYIRVIQDVRGKYGSEGDYVMTRPLRGPLNPTAVDHSTDTYDTIDWLVKNIPETNGKVGILGNFLRRISAAHGASKSASRVESRGSDESHGGRVDGR